MDLCDGPDCRNLAIERGLDGFPIQEPRGFWVIRSPIIDFPFGEFGERPSAPAIAGAPDARAKEVIAAPGPDQTARGIAIHMIDRPTVTMRAGDIPDLSRRIPCKDEGAFGGANKKIEIRCHHVPSAHDGEDNMRGRFSLSTGGGAEPLFVHAGPSSFAYRPRDRFPVDTPLHRQSRRES